LRKASYPAGHKFFLISNSRTELTEVYASWARCQENKKRGNAVAKPLTILTAGTHMSTFPFWSRSGRLRNDSDRLSSRPGYGTPVPSAPQAGRACSASLPP
jgi:hypothetical protein